jgi:putative transposase
MHDFKQATGHLFSKRASGRLWQDGYYDHIVRSEEGVLRVARYIAANPVRARIVPDAASYPYTVSLDWNRDAVVEA